MSRPLLLVILLAVFAHAFAQEPVLAPNAPPDMPQRITDREAERLEAAIAPWVAKARSTYPAAKSRFLAGLPKGQSFFVTTRLHDGSGLFEQVFVAVESIRDGVVAGRIWSDIEFVKGFRHGDRVKVPEAEILDWLITYPDGTEEGNVVGKFMESQVVAPN